MTVSARTWLSAIITIAALAVFFGLLIHATLYAPEIEAAGPPITAATSSIPVRLIIPALNINASVQDVGLNTKGAIEAPDNFVQVAWYKYGAVPGQLGTAIIDGHVDNGLGLPGVFLHLNTIQVGDDVYVQDQNGVQLHFIVSQVQAYPYQSVPMQQIMTADDAARLDLITCDGTWVNGGDTYNERLVVYTELASPEAGQANS